MAEVDRFLKDEGKDAYETQVERLLESPHYGERWGRYWLDIARYADTKGYVFEEERQVHERRRSVARLRPRKSSLRVMGVGEPRRSRSDVTRNW